MPTRASGTQNGEWTRNEKAAPEPEGLSRASRWSTLPGTGLLRSSASSSGPFRLGYPASGSCSSRNIRLDVRRNDRGVRGVQRAAVLLSPSLFQEASIDRPRVSYGGQSRMPRRGYAPRKRRMLVTASLGMPRCASLPLRVRMRRARRRRGPMDRSDAETVAARPARGRTQR